MDTSLRVVISISADGAVVRAVAHGDTELCDPSTMKASAELRSALEELGEIELHTINGATQIQGGYYCG